MKKILCLAIILSVLCAAPDSYGASSSKKKGSRAQTSSQSKSAASDKADEKKVAAATAAEDKPAADAKKSDGKKPDAKDDKKEEANGIGGGFNFGTGGDIPFDLMRADSFEIDPDGVTVLTGKVRIESKDMNLSCDQVKLNNSTKLVLATGNPVVMDQPPAIQAKCRNLTYNMQTKAAVLENEAVIIQDKNGQKTQASADTIKIDSDGTGKNQKVSLIMRKDSGRQPEIKVLGKEDKGGEKPKAARATKVSESNMGLLNIPTPKSPGIE